MPVNHRSKERRQALAKMATRLFDHWKLSIPDQAAMLGFSESSLATIMRYRKGAPLADRIDLIDRAVNLLAIHSTLRVLFPQNRDLVYKWPTTPNKAFRGLSPVQFIKDEGFMGLVVIKRHLDFQDAN